MVTTVVLILMRFLLASTKVAVSVTSLDPKLSRAMEPRASTPAKRLAAMERQGVDPELAIERVAALTDEEAGQLAEKINSAPAGGIIGALLLVFFVLLVTDILGLTKVFPFTRSTRSAR